MEIGCGQKYLVSASGVAVPVSASAIDLFAITAASNVPIYVERVVCSSNYNAAGDQPVQLVKRSTGGSGGSGMTIGGEPTSAPAASMTANSLVTTPGTLKSSYDPEYWQLFSTWEMNRKPGALLLQPGETLALLMSSVPAGFTADIHAECIEVK